MTSLATLVVIATYRTHPGQSDRVAALLAMHAIPTRAEPGCRLFIVNRCEADPEQFVLYEQYADEEAFQAHRLSQHFRDYIEGAVVPLLVERVWQRYTVVESNP